MDDVQVPEYIDMMAPAVYPIAGKIYTDESDEISKPGGVDMSNRNLICQPGIGNNGNAEAEYIFGNVGNTAAKAAYHVHIADSVFLFSPAPPFLK